MRINIRLMLCLAAAVFTVAGCAKSGNANESLETGESTTVSEGIVTTDVQTAEDVSPEKGYIKYLPGEEADQSEPIIEENTLGTLVVPECSFTAHGYIFVGWTDGRKTVYPGDDYIFAKNKGAVLTALWEKTEMVSIIYSDGGGNTSKLGEFEAGRTIKLDAPMFSRSGYTFSGWRDDTGKVVKPGLSYKVGEDDITLTAVWEKIEDGGLLSDACDAWELNDGGAAGYAASSSGGEAGSIKWGTWLNSVSFGQTLDFSTEGSLMMAERANISLEGDFTLSAYVLLPQREEGERVILSRGKINESGYSDYFDFCGAYNEKNWSGSVVGNGTEDGHDYIRAQIKKAGDLVISRSFKAVDCTEYSDGHIRVWIWVDDPSVITGGQLEITSSGAADRNETSWNITSAMLKAGWNELYLSASNANKVDGGANYSSIRYVRFYLNCSGPISVKITAPELCVISSGNSADWKLYAEEKTGILSFAAKGLEGTESSKTAINDGVWHHVMLTRSGNLLTYYVDGSAVNECTVSGAAKESTETLTIGALPDGKNGLDGSIARVRLYKSAKTPDEVTSLAAVSPEKQETTLTLLHGITSDRSQGQGQTCPLNFTKQDAINCREMGFDFVRILIWIDNLMLDDGTLNESYISWADDQVNNILDAGLNCVFSLAAGDRPTVNGRMHSEYSDFDLSVKWYGEVAEYIRSHENWTADRVAILLFCEPYCTLKEHDWTWMSDRIVTAVRNVLPDHTIITSSDNYGYIEDLKKMSPMTDTNLIYSFTSYEPYTVGFNTFNGWGVENSFWSYLGDIPYPIYKGVDYTADIERAIELVPDSLKSAAREMLTLYVNGVSDFYRVNYYDSLYNEEWHMLRAESLAKWRDGYGGNIHLFVAEFGGCDAWVNQYYFNAEKNTGISEKTRLKLISDSVEAYNAYGIAWAFWEYNESFTVFDPSLRLNYPAIVAKEQFSEIVYIPMLDALGLDYNKNLIK